MSNLPRDFLTFNRSLTIALYRTPLMLFGVEMKIKNISPNF